jgi:hypothetical protein
VANLERNWAIAEVDHATASLQFSQVANQLQVATEEATWLQESNAKLLGDLEGKLRRRFSSPFHFSFSSYEF